MARTRSRDDALGGPANAAPHPVLAVRHMIDGMRPGIRCRANKAGLENIRRNSWRITAFLKSQAMNPPFTLEQFLAVFARYTSRLPMQILLNARGLAVCRLDVSPSVWASRTKLLICLSWGGMAIAYHFASSATSILPPGCSVRCFCSEARRFAWTGMVGPMSRFGSVRPAKHRRRGVIVFALVLYPVHRLFDRSSLPDAPTFGLPCPTTIFTLGLLLFQ